VSADQIFSVRFMASCRESEKTAFLRPPLIVPLKQGRVAHITGVLEDISPRGLLAHAESDLKSLVKLWPQYLIFRCMDENNKLLLLTKKGKEVEIPIPDPKASLAEYIEYYLLAKESPSPLMPEWAKALLEGGLDQWKKAMEKEGDYGDPYLCYLKRRNGLSDAEEAISHWSDRLRCIFAPLLSGGADAL